MKFEQAFEDVEILFLDTAPVIYYVEENPNGQEAANFRAKYNLKLPDALQVAVALV